MKPVAVVASACLLVSALLAACGSDDDDAPPPVAAPSFEATSGDYERQTRTEDLSVRIRIPMAALALPDVGPRLSAQADAEVADAERRAAERRRERPGSFMPSELVMFWTVTFEDAGFMSLLGQTQLYEGGFITIETRETVVFDRASSRELAFTDLLADPRADGAALTAVSVTALAAWAEVSPSVGGRPLDLVDERTLLDARESLRPRPASFTSFTLVAADGAAGRIAGVNLLYPEGRLGPPSDGPYTLFIPASVLAGHLKPEWSARLAPEPVEIFNSSP